MRHHYFTLGAYKYCVLEDRSKHIPLIDEFDDDKKKQALHCHMMHGADDEMVEIGFNHLYFEVDGKKVLIDAGLASGDLVQSMQMAGLSPHEVEWVIITHGDDDHVGGLSNFPNAQLVMSKRAFELWTDRASREQLNKEYEKTLGKVISKERIAKGIEDRNAFGERLLTDFRDRMMLVQEDQEILQGVSLIYTPGHRSDHYCIRISSEGETLLAVGDALRHGFQYKRTHLSTVYDADQGLWTATLENIKSSDPDHHFIYFGTHFPFPGLLKYQDGLLQPLDLQ